MGKRELVAVLSGIVITSLGEKLVVMLPTSVSMCCGFTFSALSLGVRGRLRPLTVVHLCEFQLFYFMITYIVKLKMKFDIFL